jgi:hypothetical protein
MILAAHSAAMKRSLWLIFAALALIAAAVLFRYQPDRLTERDTPSERLADVTVQQELVVVPVSATGTLVPTATGGRATLQASAKQPSGRAGGPPDGESAEPAERPVTRRASVDRASRDQTIFEKARRAFIGDGRHRPEPFPRPRDN